MAIVTGLLPIALRAPTSDEPVGYHLVGYVYDHELGLESLVLATPVDWIDERAVRAAVAASIVEAT